jgi:predicted nucleic acid-binding protein
VNAVLDTNIVVDYLNGVAKADAEFRHYARPAISLITWMEVLIGVRSAQEERTVRRFLGQLEIVPITQGIAEEAVRLRREHGLRLPDAIIWATARETKCLLVSRNTRDFPPDTPGIRMPYRL